MDHGLSSLDDGSILPLYNPILLWVVRHYQLPLDPCFPTKGIKFLGGVLSSIIRSKHFDLLPCLIFNQGFEFFELAQHFILSLHKINPSFVRGIINEGNI
jgi:hypothetical protein